MHRELVVHERLRGHEMDTGDECRGCPMFDKSN